MQGDLEGARVKQEESLEMEYALHGRDTPHPGIASSLGSLAIVLKAQARLAHLNMDVVEA